MVSGSKERTKKTMGKLPDFLIIGEMKCGTTALYKYLTEHPEIEPAHRKEIAFFNLYYDKGVEWYRAQFPGCEQCLTGEAAGYLKFPYVAERVKELIPQVKLFVILRNPIDRAYSHYNMKVRKGRISAPFEKAIQNQPSYLNHGKYAWKLERWMKVFPKEQFHIIQSEKLYTQPQKTLKQALTFLELPSYPLSIYKHYNLGTYADMNPDTRKKLIDYYKPYNRKLYQLLGMRFHWDQ